MSLTYTISLSFESYRAIRNQAVMQYENRLLYDSGQNNGLHPVDGNLTIGYGWDIDVNSAEDTLEAFSDSGIALTADEQQALIDYKANTLSQEDFESAWADVVLVF